MQRRNDRQRVDFLERVGMDATVRTLRAVGLTTLTWPTVTVGMVSLPFATDRGNAAGRAGSRH